MLLLLAPTALVAQQAAVQAQVNPAATQQGNLQTQKFEQLQKQLGAGKNPTAPSIAGARGAARAPAAGTGPSFQLNRIVTNRSAILSPAAIARALAPFEHRRVHFADLESAVAALNQLYQQRGILTARAVLPRQTVHNGIVRIQLIEARLGQVRVLGAKQTPSSFYLRRLQARPGELLRLPRLRKDLILLNTSNDVAVRALLRPGRRFGTTDLVLEVAEPPSFALEPSFDNVGRASIGLQRLGMGARFESLLGDRDPLSLSSSWATGTFSQSLDYSVPLTVAGTRLDMGGDFSGIRIRSGQLQTLGITGNSLDYHMGLTQPLLAREGLVVNGTAQLQITRSLTRSNQFQLSRDLVQDVALGGNLQWFDANGVWIANDTLTFGASSLAGSHGFGKESLSLARQQRLWPDWTEILRFSGQTRWFSGAQGLPLVEQFQLGGLSSVRGYPEGWQIANTGYALTTELDYPLPLRQFFFGGAFSRGLHGAVFADHGGIFGLPGATRDLYLTSAGLGIVFSSPYLDGRLDWAAPLENRDGLKKVGFDFYLQPRLPRDWYRFWR